ncbi:NF-kappa-B-repressing factor-like [Sipha flava]|uniref:NF-kappa-B-repressing factor n=1 Tax=Sipha flava TaxID=143950 RepID=A0A2S2Q2W6_9HEMI|nr:NF-kappa-B-repressing factor-like [Sipha flava]XP_025419549.1 NF-kappa-B-repressing factor-like [Sipha flava]
MSFDTSWDIEQYKSEHETEEHWQLRQKFLITHKMKYPENRLVSLAQIFFNVEFLGCSYPKQTMDLIEKLSKGLADDFREKRKLKLQKTFVAASTVAEAKAKGNTQTAIQMINNSQSNVKKIQSTPYDSDYILPGFILLFRKDNEEPYDIIDRSCTFCGISKPSFKFNRSLDPSLIQSNLFIKKKLIASGSGPSFKIARKEASKAAFNILKEKCFIVQEKEDEELELISKSSIINDNDSKSLDTTVGDSTNEAKLSEDNIGNKILKMMGWQQGSGLGKNGQGRLNPIEIVQLPKNLGLGGSKPFANNLKRKIAFQKEIRIYVTKFLESSKRKLAFSTEFSKEERTMIHTHCIKYGLKTKSYGHHENRYIVISKKQNAKEIFKELMISNDFENEHYILKPPTNGNDTC